MGPKQQQTNKRIVSKDEYVACVARREAKRWGSVVLAIAGAACFVCTLGSAVGMLYALDFVWKGLFLLSITLSFPAGYALFKFAEKNLQEAVVKLDVVPLTRANMGDLPALDTLVRASQAPAQTDEQQAELLRAAQYGRETPAEELLRASTNQENQP